MFFKYKVSVIFQCMKYNTIITASKIPWFPIEKYNVYFIGYLSFCS